MELNQNLSTSRWSFPVFMTLFTTDKTAKKPISYLSTKMWVVSSKSAIKTFSRMCGILDPEEKMVLVDKLNTKVKFSWCIAIDFLETIVTFLFGKMFSSSFKFVLHECVFEKLFFRVKQKRNRPLCTQKQKHICLKINAWNTLNHLNRYCSFEWHFI